MSLPLPKLPLDARLPWLASLQGSLEAALRSDRLGHAVLLQVAPALGGEWLATWLAARIFCSAASTARPCGVCLACRRVLGGEQYDLQWLQPIEDSREIRIDQVREMVDELALTSHGGGRKIVILSPAERLNRAAANALLKTLEEPTRGSLLLLVTGEPSRLPSTILSRCTRLRAAQPTEAVMREWLQQHAGKSADWAAVLQVLGAKPLEAMSVDAAALTQLQRETVRALEQAAAGSLDPVGTAETWGKEDYAVRIACIEAWLLGRIRQWALREPARRGSADKAVQSLFAILDETREARHWADTPINKPLALERLLWRLNSLASSATASNRRPG